MNISDKVRFIKQSIVLWPDLEKYDVANGDSEQVVDDKYEICKKYTETGGDQKALSKQAEGSEAPASVNAPASEQQILNQFMGRKLNGRKFEEE
jgi:hypothetical protein